MITYYNSANNVSAFQMGLDLAHMLDKLYKNHSELIIFCIGTDRSTGDSLGPLIGHKLDKLAMNNVIVIGTLNEPVHAGNIMHYTDYIYDTFENPLILSIDASLGKRNHVGYFTLATGPLIPGLGINKALPEIGDLHITGIVNYTGIFDGMLLQTTRLNSVMNLADTISSGIKIGLTQCHHFKNEIYA